MNFHLSGRFFAEHGKHQQEFVECQIARIVRTENPANPFAEWILLQLNPEESCDMWFVMQKCNQRTWLKRNEISMYSGLRLNQPPLANLVVTLLSDWLYSITRIK